MISYLAGTVLGAERVMLIIPAKLREKTRREFSKLSKHWRGPKRMHIMSYELLSRDRGLAELEAYRPDLVVADEAHKFKNTSAACTKRIRRYLTKTHPDCGYVDMSGTIVKRSILEFYHRQNWALPDGAQPLPRPYNEVCDWADALDVGPSALGRLMPGALMQLCNPEELAAVEAKPTKGAHIRAARSGFQRRLLSTPGVVGTEEMFDGAMSIIMTGVEWTPGDAVIDAFARLRATWELPDGHPIDQASTLWQAARCLIQGFYYRWDPEPPVEWMQWRKEWGRMVREILHRYRDIDSPMIAAREVEKGRIPWASDTLAQWQAVRGIYTPKTVAHWIDDAAYKFCLDWANKNTGLIWVNEVAMGQRLLSEGGIPYYGAQGKCGKEFIEDERATCAASIAANTEGRNLQHAFSKNLVVAPPPGGSVWEQMIGRTHREGQQADEVTVEVALGCYENWRVVMQALQDAEFQERTTGQCQKLNFADAMLPTSAEIEERANSGDPLWSKDNADFFKGENTGWSASEITTAELSIADRARKRRETYAGG